MQTYFSGTFLDAAALSREQSPIETTRYLVGSPAVGAAASAIAESAAIAALNPQPLPREEPGFNAELIASLPASLLDSTAPAPALPVSQPSGVAGQLKSPSQLLREADVIATVNDGLQAGPELLRHELWRDAVRLADQTSLGSARERHTLKNLIGDDPAEEAKRWARDRVLPYDPSDFVGGVGSYPIEGDRMRAPLFVKGASDADEVSMNDIKQGKIGDCYFMASLAAVAREHPAIIKNMVVDHGDGTYTVTFKERIDSSGPAQYRDHPITVTGDFPGGLNGSGHAGAGDATKQKTAEIWPLVFEKAYGQFINEVNPYATLDLGGHSRAALEAITGQPVKARGDMEDDLAQMGISNPIYLGPTLESFDELLADFLAGKAITVSTSKTTQGLVPSHCYAVQNVWRDADGRQWVQLYNPWGQEHPKPMPFEQLQALRIYTV